MFRVDVMIRCDLCRVNTLLDNTGFVFPAMPEQIGRHTEGCIRLPDGWRERIVGGNVKIVEHVCPSCVAQYVDPFRALDAISEALGPLFCR